MYRDKTILAIVPARSGSKRIPDKNMQEINGVSLIGWAGKCLQDIIWTDAEVLSTDSETYSDEGHRWCLPSGELRPEKLSQDDTPIEDVIFYHWTLMKSAYDIDADIILLLEPTSPMRKPEDIKNAVDMLIDSGADSVVSVSEMDIKYHPNRLIEIYNREVEFYESREITIIDPIYYRNGICYALTRETVQKKQIITANTAPLFIDRPVVNIDTPLDLEIARRLMKDD